MKDQYVGDINDYLKYALLRAVAPPGELAVIWMLTSDDGRSDGLRLRYLAQPDIYRHLDPPLFDALGGVVSAKRTVRAIEAANILPAIVFVSDVVPDDVASRVVYFRKVLRSLSTASLAFFDPDNGLEVASVRKGRRNSSKYIYVDELVAAYESGLSLIVYQHFPRRQRALFLADVAKRLRSDLGCQHLFALKTPFAAFLVVPRTEADVRLSSQLECFASRAAGFRTVLAAL